MHHPIWPPGLEDGNGASALASPSAMWIARQPFAAVSPLPWLVAVGLLVGPDAPVPAGAQPDLSTALVSALAREGLLGAAEEVTWLDAPRGLWGSLFSQPFGESLPHLLCCRHGKGDADDFVGRGSLSDKPCNSQCEYMGFSRSGSCQNEKFILTLVVV